MTNFILFEKNIKHIKKVIERKQREYFSKYNILLK